MSPPRAGTAPALSDEELRELLGLLEGADSAELKLTVAEEQRQSAVGALGIDPLDAHIRQVFFFDTPDLALDNHGVVARARRIQGKGDDCVIKLRPVVPEKLPADIRASKNFVVEVDAMPGGFVCSASFKGTTKNVRETVAGDRPLRKLFSKEQREFFAAHAPEAIGLDDLAVLGPINVVKLKFAPEGRDRKIAAELWSYPDGSRILELSTKCSPGEAFQVAAETRAYLSGCGLTLSGHQATKTRTALEWFSQNLP